MTTDKIRINNQGNGFEEAVRETKRIAAFQGLDQQNSLRLQLITEEMLSLVKSITGETEATFWIEENDGRYDLHMDTRTRMNRNKRDMLLATSTKRENEAARSFLGYLRDKIENAMLSDAEDTAEDVPVAGDVYLTFDDEEADGFYEQSVLRCLADKVSVSIRGKTVEMTVTRDFSA